LVTAANFPSATARVHQFIGMLEISAASSGLAGESLRSPSAM